MSDRPYTILSCAQSLDGYLDDATDQRLLLSNAADLDRVDAVRAASDAVLVGAATVRSDDPRLQVRSPALRRRRAYDGLAPSPLRVTMSRRGDLDPTARFFGTRPDEALVYVPGSVFSRTAQRLDEVATVIDGGRCVDVQRVGEDLHARGVRRMLVEGGGQTLTQFLTADAADELHLVVAPLFVGDARASRFVGDGRFPFHDGRRAELADVRRIGDVVLMRYALSARFAAEAHHDVATGELVR